MGLISRLAKVHISRIFSYSRCHSCSPSLIQLVCSTYPLPTVSATVLPTRFANCPAVSAFIREPLLDLGGQVFDIDQHAVLFRVPFGQSHLLDLHLSSFLLVFAKDHCQGN